jgi:hypothetical protein
MAGQGSADARVRATRFDAHCDEAHRMILRLAMLSEVVEALHGSIACKRGATLRFALRNDRVPSRIRRLIEMVRRIEWRAMEAGRRNTAHRLREEIVFSARHERCLSVDAE